MATNTSSLSQLDVKQSYASTNNSDRAMLLRRMLPNLLINAVVPLLINTLARPYMSTIDALLLASSVPALFTLGALSGKNVSTLWACSLSWAFFFLPSLPWCSRAHDSCCFRALL